MEIDKVSNDTLLLSRDDIFTIDDFFPKHGSELGGTRIVLTGNNFYSTSVPYYCRFGNISTVSAERVSNNELLCATPSYKPGWASLTIINSDYEIKLSSHFEFTILINLFSIIPSFGSSGSDISLTGSGFRNVSSLSCLFGSDHHKSKASFISDAKIQCTVPVNTSQNTSKVPISVSNNGFDIEGDWAGVEYTIVPLPNILRIEPISAPTSGGTKLIVEYDDKYQHENIDIVCIIGTHLSLHAILLSDKRVQCITPVISLEVPQSIPILISFNGGHEFSISKHVRLFVHPPSVLYSVFPDSVPEIGNSVITIMGDHFYRNPNLKCVFDDIQTNATWLSTYSVTCKTPVSKRSQISLYISTNDQEGGLSANFLEFAFSDAVTLSSVSPHEGSVYGGDHITFKGTGFELSPDFFCRFGELIVNATMVLNSTEAICVSPPSKNRENGSVPIDISTNQGATFTSSGLTYMYTTKIYMRVVNPNMGPSYGVTEIDINGAFQEYAQKLLYCRFHINENGSKHTFFSPVHHKSYDMLSCRSPLISMLVRKDMLVSTLDLTNEFNSTITYNSLPFIFYGSFSISKIDPSVGSELGKKRNYLKYRIN